MPSNKRLQQTQAQVDEVRYIFVWLGDADMRALAYFYGIMIQEQLFLADFKFD